VFVLKKEVLFEQWREVFAQACHALGIRKIVKSTPAVKDHTTKFNATCETARKRLETLRMREPKYPGRIKEQPLDLTNVAANDREKYMVEYQARVEKADAAFDKEWTTYLTDKRTYDMQLRSAEEDMLRLKSMEPQVDDDVVVITAKSKVIGSKSIPYTATFEKTQALDAEESKLFGVDHEWINSETGEYESAEETVARMKLWKWLGKSLEGGPCKLIVPSCQIPGDVRSVYYAVKEKCTRVTVLTFGLALSDFFRRDKYLKESDPQIIYTSLKQEASTLDEMGKKLDIPPTLHPQIIKSQLMVALMMNTLRKRIRGP
jgi:hypothetical protein